MEMRQTWERALQSRQHLHISRIQEKPIKQTIDNILSNAAKSRMSAMTAEYNKLILETKGAL